MTLDKSLNDPMSKTLLHNVAAKEQALNQFKSEFYRTQMARAEKKSIQKKGSSYILSTEAAILASQRPIASNDFSLN